MTMRRRSETFWANERGWDVTPGIGLRHLAPRPYFIGSNAERGNLWEGEHQRVGGFGWVVRIDWMMPGELFDGLIQGFGKRSSYLINQLFSTCLEK